MPLTFQEFLVYVKGWEYIIAILFVLSFVAFWQVLSRDRPREG